MDAHRALHDDATRALASAAAARFVPRSIGPPSRHSAWAAAETWLHPSVGATGPGPSGLVDKVDSGLHGAAPNYGRWWLGPERGAAGPASATRSRKNRNEDGDDEEVDGTIIVWGTKAMPDIGFVRRPTIAYEDPPWHHHEDMFPGLDESDLPEPHPPNDCADAVYACVAACAGAVKLRSTIVNANVVFDACSDVTSANCRLIIDKLESERQDRELKLVDCVYGLIGDGCIDGSDEPENAFEEAGKFCPAAHVSESPSPDPKPRLPGQKSPI